MTTSHWIRQHTFKIPDAVADVVVVGGGLVGLSTAYWLTELRPDLKITVLDRGHCGSGASGRNAGFLTLGSASFYRNLAQKWGVEKALLIQQFARESLELLKQHILMASPEIKFEKSSSMTLFQSESQFQSWQNTFDSKSFDFTWLSENELPASLQTRFYGGYETGPEYKINPMQLLSSLKKILENRKVQIIENSSAYEITYEGLKTELNTIKCRQIVMAINGYFPQFHEAFKTFIKPNRAQMLAIELSDALDCPHLYYDPPERVYWRKINEKVLIIGGKRVLDESGETGDFEKISPKIQKGLELYLTEQLGLSFKVLNRWSGTMGFTEHELPLIGKINAPIETYMIGGFSGHGMGLGFNSAKDVVELLLGATKHSFFSQFKTVDFNL
jgi:glycine/D-amino acid oxidase-like deaminating enzyme